MMHLVLHRDQISIRRVRKFVVGITREHFVFVFEVFLEEEQAATIRRQRRQSKNVLMSSFGEPQRSRPHELWRIRCHHEVAFVLVRLAKVKNFDLLVRLHKLLTLDDLLNLELGLGERSIGVGGGVRNRWCVNQAANDDHVHCVDLFRESLRDRRTKRTRQGPRCQQRNNRDREQGD